MPEPLCMWPWLESWWLNSSLMKTKSVFFFWGSGCFGVIRRRPFLAAQMQSRCYTPGKLALEGNKQGVIWACLCSSAGAITLQYHFFCPPAQTGLIDHFQGYCFWLAIMPPSDWSPSQQPQVERELGLLGSPCFCFCNPCTFGHPVTFHCCIRTPHHFLVDPFKLKQWFKKIKSLISRQDLLGTMLFLIFYRQKWQIVLFLDGLKTTDTPESQREWSLELKFLSPAH